MTNNNVIKVEELLKVNRFEVKFHSNLTQEQKDILRLHCFKVHKNLTELGSSTLSFFFYDDEKHEVYNTLYLLSDKKYIQVNIENFDRGHAVSEEIKIIGDVSKLISPIDFDWMENNKTRHLELKLINYLSYRTRFPAEN
jgi:hypothetical protein